MFDPRFSPTRQPLAAVLGYIGLIGAAFSATCLLQQDQTGGGSPPAAEPPESRRAVLVTGASSGIGRTTTEFLAANGFYVYAGARSPEDLEDLARIPNVRPLRLDVTIPEEIDAAVEKVEEEGRGLYGLINNAGVIVVAPLIEVAESELAYQLDVNVLGPYRVTRAFAPLLIESKGRILTTGSLSGVFTGSLGGPYTMSKHAIEAFTECLEAEVSRFGVGVSVIEPGNYRSAILRNMHQRLDETGYSTENSRYRELMDRMLGQPADLSQYEEPDDVARAFLRALNDKTPKRRYVVVPNQRERELVIRASVRRLVSWNAGLRTPYSDGELVEMLKEELERARR